MLDYVAIDNNSGNRHTETHWWSVLGPCSNGYLHTDAFMHPNSGCLADRSLAYHLPRVIERHVKHLLA